MFTLLVPPVGELDVIRDDLGDRLDRVVICSPDLASVSLSFAKLLRANRYDLVHSHGLSAGLLAALPMSLSKVPHVVTLHDVFLEGLFRGVKGQIKHSVINWGLRRPDVLHLLGDDPQANLEEFFPFVARQRGKVTIVKSGIEVDRFSVNDSGAGKDTLRAENEILKSVPVLGFFGRFMAQKGFGTLVDAVEMLSKDNEPSKVPVVVAFGSGGYLDREIRSLQSRQLIQHFRFLPFLPNIAEALSQLDGVVMPSRWETAPLLPMEVLVHGTPLIASDCIGLREVVEGTPAFSFEAGNARSLADAMCRWSEAPRKSEFREFAPLAANRFDVKNTAAGLQDLYARISSESSNHSGSENW